MTALKQEDVELPSDLSGIVWISRDPRGAWKAEVAREMEDAGLVIDWVKVGRS